MVRMGRNGYASTPVGFCTVLCFTVLACRSPTSPPPAQPPTGYDPVTLSDTYSGLGDEAIVVSTSGAVQLSYSLHALSGQDVYFVLTNTNLSETADNPWVSGSAGYALPTPRAVTPEPGAGEPFPRAPTPPEIERFNNDPFGLITAASSPAPRGVALPQPAGPEFYVEGDQGTLFDRDESAVSATVRGISTADTNYGLKSVVVWVDDACWSASDSSLSGKVSPQMAAALALEFLQPGSDNDICDWVGGIFGDEWGPPPVDYLIDDDGEIHILLYDIDGDGLPVEGESRVWGFYSAVNNFHRTDTGSDLDYSNERIMFYLDAPIFADDTDGDGSWEIREDYCPANMLSVLAHEYQHMIHFYQKIILQDASHWSATWLNEMASLVAEDFVSSSLGVKGPRGIDPADGTAGSPYIRSGRLPLFVATPETSVTDWQEGEDVLASYSVAYAFGAYLARNFGGPLFFRSLVQCSETDHGAVEYALQQAGFSDTFEQILRKWAVAVLLSDSTALGGTGAQYNCDGDGWFGWTLDGLGYELGSINMYNYQYGSQQGPYLYTGDGPVGPGNGQPPASNLLFLAGEDLYGTRSWTVWLPDSVKLSVVIRD